MSARDENEKAREDEGPHLPWYQRPWLSSLDGFNLFPTSWGGLIALIVIIVAGVVAVNWVSSLF